MSSYLPEEIIFDIFLRLPAKCIVRSRCVCKTWLNLFKNPKFINMHLNLNHHAIENKNNTSFLINDCNKICSIRDDSSSQLSLPDAAVEVEYPLKHAGYHHVRIEGTCNGLICLSLSSNFKDSILLLWNPCTGEYKEIPKPYEDISDSTADLIHFLKQRRQSVTVRYGFAYDCIIDDYKLLRIESVYDRYTEIMVFTLGSNSWRWVRRIDYFNLIQGQPGVFVNRAFLWTATRTYSKVKVILSFDIGEENVIQKVPKPKRLHDKVNIGLGLLEGCLCIVTLTQGGLRTDVWVMKEFGVIESWTKLFAITELTFIVSTFARPLRCYNNGDIILQKNQTELLFYNPKHEKTSIRKITNIQEYHSTLWTFVGSFVSLESGTYVGQDQEETNGSFREKKKMKL